MPRYVALPASLTAEEPEPAAPPAECTWPGRQALPVLCNKATVDLLDALKAWGRTLNGKLREIRSLEQAEIDKQRSDG